MKNALIFFVAIVIAGGAGFTLQRYLNDKQQSSAPAIGQPRPEFAAEGLDGKIHNIKEWDNKVILLNFWATWCPPCKREIPDFIELQNEYGEQDFQVIGIAIDEMEPVREFVEKIGINYPIIAVQTEGVELARRYGNTVGALPYSVFIDKDGTISATIVGELSKKRAVNILEHLGLNTH